MSSFWAKTLAAGAIAAAGLAAYANSFEGVFLFDDRPSIIENPNVRTLAPWAHPLTAMQAPRNLTLSGRPVASFTFAVNYALAAPEVRNIFDPPAPGSYATSTPFARNVWGYHAANLIIHLAAALVLFGVLTKGSGLFFTNGRFVKKSPEPFALALPATVAALWVVHPLTTGAVTYIVQRVESLMALFVLLTLYCSIRAWEHRGWMAPAIAACALGMGTKEAMVGAPLIVLAWDWTFTRLTFGELVRRRAALYAGLAATWIVLAVIVAADPRPLSSGFGFAEWPWWKYLATQTGVLAHYLRLAVFPRPLVLDYDWPAPAHLLAVAAPAALLIALFAATIVLIARRQAVGFAGACSFILLAPTSSVLPIITEIAAEHRMYLPLAAVIATLVFAIDRALGRWRGHAAVRGAAAVAVVAAVVALGVQTRARNDDYATDIGMWADTIAKRPDNARARNNYASDLLKSGQAAAAEPHLRIAVERSPQFAEAHANLGVSLATQGKTAEAIEHFERALAINPFYTAVFENLAEAYGAENHLGLAVKYYLKALDQRPDDVALLNKAGWILATASDASARDGAEALRLAQHAVDLTHRDDASSLDTLAVAFAELGRFDDAVTAGTAALARARARGDRIYLDELNNRLALYLARKPVRM